MPTEIILCIGFAPMQLLSGDLVSQLKIVYGVVADIYGPLGGMFTSSITILAIHHYYIRLTCSNLFTYVVNHDDVVNKTYESLVQVTHTVVSFNCT